MKERAMWYVGQKVICIDGIFPPQFFEWGDRIPVKNEMYTIRRISQGTHGLTGRIALSFLLEEIVNPEFEAGREVMFSAQRFRPLTGGHHHHQTAEKPVEILATRG
jgi:hypothetical protein